jgi:hypothetical protein
MGEIVTDYFEAVQRFGRPTGPFERDRQCIYNAGATVKPGPRVDQRHQESPSPPMVRPWWDESEEEPPF